MQDIHYIWLRKADEIIIQHMRLSNVSLNNLVNLKKVITDQAPSTKVAMAKVIKAFKLNPDRHCTSKYLNNLIEQDHRHIK